METTNNFKQRKEFDIMKKAIKNLAADAVIGVYVGVAAITVAHIIDISVNLVKTSIEVNKTWTWNY